MLIKQDESYKLLDGSGIMRDSYEIADFRYAPNGTFNGFHPDRKTDSRIDHLFLTKEFEVKKYGIFNDTYRSEGGKRLEGAKRYFRKRPL